MYTSSNTNSQNSTANIPSTLPFVFQTVDDAGDTIEGSYRIALNHHIGDLQIRPSNKIKRENEVNAFINECEELSKRHIQFQNEYVVRGNNALYGLLSEIYALAIRIDESYLRENILAQMRTALKERNVKTQRNTPPLTTVIKFVVGTDRQTASNYSRALTVASEQDIAANELAEYISRRGGISKIRETENKANLNKLNSHKKQERLDILREFSMVRAHQSKVDFQFSGDVARESTEESDFCFFMAVHTGSGNNYRIISASEVGKTAENILLRHIYQSMTKDIKILKNGLVKLKKIVIEDASVPLHIVKKLQEEIESKTSSQYS